MYSECEWPDDLVTRLRVLGELLVGALERQAMFDELREAEERVSLAADSAEAGLWTLDYGTGVFWATPRTRVIFGFGPDEVIDMPRLAGPGASRGLGDRQGRDRTGARGSRCRSTSNTASSSRARAHVRWIAARGQRHVSPSGEPGRLMGYCLDVSARKQAEEAQRRSEARLESGADLAGLAFYEVDFRARVAFVDDRFRTICGMPPERAQGLEPVEFWAEHIHPEDRARVMDQRTQLHGGTQNRIDIEYRFLHPAQGEKWIHHVARVSERDAAGHAVQTFGVIRDVTASRRAQEDLRRSLAEIEQLKDRLQAESDYLKAEVKVSQAQGEVTGQSPAILRLLRQVEQVAPTDSSVLILGETGSGKELVAQAIHRLSPRHSRVVVKVNCAALPAGLVESELFGREKGAFTGALTRQIGRFEVADGSTLFLDEVGELPLDLQAKLLRVLEIGEFERLGSPKPIKVDVRVIAATNRDLTAEIRNGRFRQDLYYRLNVFPLRVPPLRERPEDIPQLVWVFLGQLNARMGKKITRVPRKTMEALQRHPWPGNVRELRNVIEHGAIVSTGDTLRVPLLDETAQAATPTQTLADAEREHIRRAIETAGGHINGPNGAAAALGINRGTLYGRMRKLGIPMPGPKSKHS